MPDEEKTRQEKAPLREVPDSFSKIVLVRDVVKPTYDNEGILTMSVFDFLLDEESLPKKLLGRTLNALQESGNGVGNASLQQSDEPPI